MKRIDLFGVIDIIAIRDDFPVLGVQSTSWGARKPHIDKILNAEGSFNWLKARGTELWLVSWKKQLMKKGGTAFRYIPHIDSFSITDCNTLSFKELVRHLRSEDSKATCNTS